MHHLSNQLYAAMHASVTVCHDISHASCSPVGKITAEQGGARRQTGQTGQTWQTWQSDV